MGLLQDADFKTSAELAAAGANDSYLLNASKIWVAGKNKRLDQAIVDGDLTGASGVPGGGTQGQILGVATDGSTEWKTLAGASGVTIVHSQGLMTITPPQDLRTSASPTFSGLTVSGTAGIGVAADSSNGLRVKHSTTDSSGNGLFVWREGRFTTSVFQNPGVFGVNSTVDISVPTSMANNSPMHGLISKVRRVSLSDDDSGSATAIIGLSSSVSHENSLDGANDPITTLAYGLHTDGSVNTGQIESFFALYLGQTPDGAGLASQWQANAPYFPGARVKPAGTQTGFHYVCVEGGTSGASEPSWEYARGLPVTDGTVMWKTVLVPGANNLYGVYQDDYKAVNIFRGKTRIGNDAEPTESLSVAGNADITGTVTATSFSGPLEGDVTGNVTGNLVGDVTGNVTGNLTGNVTGNVSGTAGSLSGVVEIANGGTGQTTALAALNALLPTQTGNANKALVTDGASVSWSSFASGGGEPFAVTGVLAAGQTDIAVGNPFELNKFSTSQVGAVMLVLDGVPQMRNVGNAAASPSADGNYQEVPADATTSNLLRLNQASDRDRTYMVYSLSGYVDRPSDSILAYIESVNGAVNAMKPYVADAAGVSQSVLGANPSNVDLKTFGDQVLAVTQAVNTSPVWAKLTTVSTQTITYANGGVTTLKFNTVAKDVLSGYNLSTGVYTFQRPGVYRVYANNYVEPASGLWTTALYFNGSIASYGNVVAVGGGQSQTCSIFEVAAGNTVDVRGSVNSGTGNCNFGANAAHRDQLIIERLFGG